MHFFDVVIHRNSLFITKPILADIDAKFSRFLFIFLIFISLPSVWRRRDSVDECFVTGQITNVQTDQNRQTGDSNNSRVSKRLNRNFNGYQKLSVRGEENPKMIAFRVDDKDVVVGYESGGTIFVSPDKEFRLRIFGRNLRKVDQLRITTSDVSCDRNQVMANIAKDKFDPLNDNDDDEDVSQLVAPLTLEKNNQKFHLCLCVDGNSNAGSSSSQRRFRRSVNNASFNSLEKDLECFHDGKTSFLRTKLAEHYLPLWLQIMIILVLLILSGLFSGLNLGLMALDKTELKIILKVGDPREREYAKKIYPIRKSGNYLLCTLLLGNVVVNSTISILFDDLTTGLIAVIFSSLGIVIFGEILPQAVCSRYGLAVGAYTFWITRFFMVLTFPLSYPISKVLDKALGEEVRQVYNRERLLELIRLSKEEQAADLGTCQEVQIVTGALELSKKTVGEVMTPIGDVFMLSSDAMLDPKTVSEIVRSGFTRIPVYEPNDRDSIVNMLNVKDLALLDPEDKIPLNTICQFYHHPVRFVMRDTPLWTMLEEFKKGHYHLAIVQHICTEGEGDPIYEAVGLITLEDIIEEIIQSEIRDEFDVIRDSRLKRLKRRDTTLAAAAAAAAARASSGGGGIVAASVTVPINPSDVSIFFNQNIDACDISPQLTLAAYQYLSTTLDAFRQEFISENVLQRLMRQNVLKKAIHESSQDTSSATGACLYTKNRECNYFLLVLEGKCSITVGESDLLFEAGPFCYFGYELLQKIIDDIRKRRTSLVGLPSVTALASAAPLGSSWSPGLGAVLSSTSQNQVATTTQQNQSCQPMSPLAKTTATTATSSPVDISGRKFSFTPDFTLKCDRQLVLCGSVGLSSTGGPHIQGPRGIGSAGRLTQFIHSNRTDLVYLKISASVYTKAYRATLIERGRSLMLNNAGRMSGGGTAGPGIDSMTPLSSPSNDDPSQRHVTGSQSAENVSMAGGSATPTAFNIHSGHFSSNNSMNNIVASSTRRRHPHIGSILSLDLKSDSIIKEEQDHLLSDMNMQ